MFQRFTLSLLNLSLGVLGTHLGAHEHRKSCILRVLACLGASLLGAMRLQGSPWEIPWATRWETWGPICYAHTCFSVSHRSLLNVSLGAPWDVLGGACGIPRASWWVLGASLGLLGGYLETPWGSLVALGVFLGDSLGGHGVPSGGSLSGPSAPYATHTDVPAFRAFRCSCVILLDYWLLSWS